MGTEAMFMDCPEYMDKQGTMRCGLPAEVECRYIIRSTEGPLLSVKIRCPRGHWFNGPVESLIWEGDHGEAVPEPAHAPPEAAVSLPASRPWRH
jgi:hypothetical protein